MENKEYEKPRLIDYDNMAIRSLLNSVSPSLVAKRCGLHYTTVWRFKTGRTKSLSARSAEKIKNFRDNNMSFNIAFGYEVEDYGEKFRESAQGSDIDFREALEDASSKVDKVAMSKKVKLKTCSVNIYPTVKQKQGRKNVSLKNKYVRRRR